MEKIQKKNTGITLVALVITIIILLILAGITINSLTNSGLLGKAQESTRISEIKEIEEAARISYMERQMEEVVGGEQATMAGVISDLREKGYTIKEATSGTNSVTGIKLNKSEISMGKNSTEEITYEYEYASGTTIRYFVEVQGKNYEILFNNGEIIVTTIATDLTDIDKLPEVTVSSSNNEIVEAQKTGEGKISLTSKEKGGEVTITVTCSGKPVTCKVTVELFTGLDKDNTNPEGALPEGEIEIIEDDASKGIVIKDKNDREWVWIEVPKTIFTTANALGEERTQEELNAAIKADLITYAGIYRNSPRNSPGEWIDTWYSECGIADATTYNTMYNKMINSVYTNGGFWIQRYEDGTVNITYGDAQVKASGYAPDETKTSSLLFGIQWDLVCRYLDGKEGLTTAMINSDSSSWGNYNGSPNARQERNKKMNIYDFAGNLSEFTLEKTTNSRGLCSIRGGRFNMSSSLHPASDRFVSGGTSYILAYITFRSTFY
jgi:Tfp pilus assembly protein PilE